MGSKTRSPGQLIEKTLYTLKMFSPDIQILINSGIYSNSQRKKFVCEVGEGGGGLRGYGLVKRSKFILWKRSA